MNNPAYIGLSILEISKIVMYTFCYDYVKSKYNKKAKLCYRDADGFILHKVQQLCPETIYLDAPLSLPMVYSRPGQDYFYRESDKVLGAMSPMFLGGLTARAMRLKFTLEQIDIKVFEIYPAGLVKSISAGAFYKKDLDAFAKEMEEKMQITCPTLASWHQADAVLAWCSGLRHHQGVNASYGRQEEGIIII